MGVTEGKKLIHFFHSETGKETKRSRRPEGICDRKRRDDKKKAELHKNSLILKEVAT